MIFLDDCNFHNDMTPLYFLKLITFADINILINYYIGMSLLRVTRGTHNPNLQVAITHTQHVYTVSSQLYLDFH